MTLNWLKNDYFLLLINYDENSNNALELTIDDIHTSKEETVNRLLCHSASEDCLWGLAHLLGSKNQRVAGNAAYILGTIAECELGCFKVISMINSCHFKNVDILLSLTGMLLQNDSESVMNAAGTMGTIAESAEGRLLLLNNACINELVERVTDLLTCENMWTASNAALVLARLSIAEEGCEFLLNHEKSLHLLSCLVSSLGVDEAGRGMNAAFALGRLCDTNHGRDLLLQIQQIDNMVNSLVNMLKCSDTGASKNACFALSCLAASNRGHVHLLNGQSSNSMLQTLSSLLFSTDAETCWFAAMTLHTLADKVLGYIKLREHLSIIPSLNAIKSKIVNVENNDLYAEVTQTLDLLKGLEKPSIPNVEVKGPHQIYVSWAELTTKFTVKYSLFSDSQCVYEGEELSYQINNLLPFTSYTFTLSASTEGSRSPTSDPVTALTEESVPSSPTNSRILVTTTNQLKVAWEPPEHPNGRITGYYIYNSENLVEHSTELSCIISGLSANSNYQIQICAATSKGKGPFSTINATTAELGAHAPSRPDVLVRGRHELHITWRAPQVPLGRIMRYELALNNEIVYSGIDLYYSACRLKPDTEYTVTVSVITNEGKCESKPVKKRTAKDEYEVERAPLYQPPPKKENQSTNTTCKTTNIRRKSISDNTPSKTYIRSPSSIKMHNRPSSPEPKAVIQPTDKKLEPNDVQKQSIEVEDTTQKKFSYEIQKESAKISSLKMVQGDIGASQTTPWLPSPSHDIDITLLNIGNSKVVNVLPKPQLPKKNAKEILKCDDLSSRHSKKIKSRSKSEGLLSNLLNEELKNLKEPCKSSTPDFWMSPHSQDTLEKKTFLQKRNSVPSFSDERSFSTSRGSPVSGRLNSSTAKTLGNFIELDAPLPLAVSKEPFITPANCVLNAYRNAKDKTWKNPRLTQSWEPELPTKHNLKETNSYKFVPMQFRTQPSNLPMRFQKQATQLHIKTGDSKKLDSIIRSNTSADFIHPSITLVDKFEGLSVKKNQRFSSANKYRIS